MKKFILPIILLILFMPFYVNAETCDTDKITIENIAVESKSDNVEELNQANASGKSINLNLSMSEVGDNIEYKFVVKNDSNEVYELDKTSLNLNSDYINYSFETDDNTNIVKANSSKNVTLRIVYKTEVPEDKFESGSYNDNKTMIVQLSNGNTINVPDTFKNPNTGAQSYIIIILILLLISGSLYVLLKKKKYAKFLILIIGTAIIIPISVYALCKCNITISSNIRINHLDSCSFAEDTWSEISNNIKNGELDCYHLGDEKDILFENFYDPFLKDNIGNIHFKVRIANISNPTECYSDYFSGTACGFVVEFSDIITEYYMNEEITNIGGYPGSQLYEYINNELYEYLPQDLKDNIIETKVLSGHEYGKSTNHVTYDKLYLLSPVELYGESFTENADRGIETSRQLDYYDLKETSLENWGATHKKYNSSEFGSNVYWLRSAVFYPNSTNNSGFYVNNGNENWSYNRFTSQNVVGVSPAFRIG